MLYLELPAVPSLVAAAGFRCTYAPKRRLGEGPSPPAWRSGERASYAHLRLAAWFATHLWVRSSWYCRAATGHTPVFPFAQFLRCFLTCSLVRRLGAMPLCTEPGVPPSFSSFSSSSLSWHSPWPALAAYRITDVWQVGSPLGRGACISFHTGCAGLDASSLLFGSGAYVRKRNAS